MFNSLQCVGVKCSSPVVGFCLSKPLPVVGGEGGVTRTYENEHLGTSKVSHENLTK